MITDVSEILKLVSEGEVRRYIWKGKTPTWWACGFLGYKKISDKVCNNLLCKDIIVLGKPIKSQGQLHRKASLTDLAKPLL